MKAEEPSVAAPAFSIRPMPASWRLVSLWKTSPKGGLVAEGCSVPGGKIEGNVKARLACHFCCCIGLFRLFCSVPKAG